MTVFILDIDRIEAARNEARIGRKIVLFQSTASTNDIAWEYAANTDNDGLCVLAESQHKGRGRRGRTWFSQPGRSILCSVLLTKTSIEAELLTLTAAVAVAEAINQSKHIHRQAELDRAARLQCRIKWPNDILIKDKKVAGILVEKQIKNSRPCFVIGIGINCNQTSEFFAAHELNMPATSLAIQAGQTVDRSALVCELLKQLENWLDKARADIRLRSSSNAGQAAPPANRQSSIVDHQFQNPVIARWLQLSGMLGQHLAVECDGRRYSGFCRGVDPAAGLILQLDNSLVRMFSASHTSVAYEPKIPDGGIL